MTSKDYHKIITAIYRQYNPDKVNKVASLLAKYKGQEETLLQSIYTKYKVSLNEKVRFERTDVALPNITEIYNNEASATNINPNRKYYWIGGLLLLLLLTISAWWYNTKEKESNNADSIQKQNVIQPETSSQNISKDNTKYPSLVLGDLAQLRRNPDKIDLLTAKGYQLNSTENGKKIFVGTLSDTVIVEKNWSGNVTQISWWAGTNREWLYNHMKNEMIKKYRYVGEFSNTDESDNRLEGLPYFEDEFYLDDSNIHYKTYIIKRKTETIGYGVRVNEFVSGYH